MYGHDFTKKKRVIVKVGSSTITHDATGNIDYTKLERLVRQLCDLRAQGKDVCLVSSGAISFIVPTTLTTTWFLDDFLSL